jgi:hypothetical protein
VPIQYSFNSSIPSGYKPPSNQYTDCGNWGKKYAASLKLRLKKLAWNFDYLQIIKRLELNGWILSGLFFNPGLNGC